MSLPQAPRKEAATAGKVAAQRTLEEEVPASQAEVLAAAAVAAHNPFPGGEVRIFLLLFPPADRGNSGLSSPHSHVSS